jgi:hypothetical protein
MARLEVKYKSFVPFESDEWSIDESEKQESMPTTIYDPSACSLPLSQYKPICLW